MGFSISKIDDFELNEYIGSRTVHSLADQGAFDTDVSPYLEKLSDDNEQIIVIVDKNGIDHFLNIAKGNTGGKYRDKFINYVEKSYAEGFMLHY